MPKKKILVTGSAGFIFSNFMRMTQHEGSKYELVSVDKVQQDKNLRNIYEHRRQKFYLADVADRHIMDRLFQIEKPDIVVHGAAESFVDDSIADATPFINSNVLGTQVMVDMCVKYNVDRLVYTSTDEVCGQFTDSSSPGWTEDSPLAPRNPYSASKAAGELVIRAAHETHGLNYNITRSCNNFGPRQQLKNFIPKIIRCIVMGEKIPVYGQGLQVREWIHVQDNCTAIHHIIGGPTNETYNISAGYDISNLELVNMVCNIMGKGHDLISFVDDRPGHDFRYAVDNSKLRDLGWAPLIKFKEGLQTTCDWYTKNQWFLK